MDTTFAQSPCTFLVAAKICKDFSNTAPPVTTRIQSVEITRVPATPK